MGKVATAVLSPGANNPELDEFMGKLGGADLGIVAPDVQDILILDLKAQRKDGLGGRPDMTIPKGQVFFVKTQFTKSGADAYTSTFGKPPEEGKYYWFAAGGDAGGWFTAWDGGRLFLQPLVEGQGVDQEYMVIKNSQEGTSRLLKVEGTKDGGTLSLQTANGFLNWITG
jgi:hypothetical protein